MTKLEQNTKDIAVKDIMKKSVMTIDSQSTIIDAAKLMKDARIGAIIITENNTPIGILTDRDLAVKALAHSYHLTTKVKVIMSSPLISINPTETVRMAADLMHTRGIRKLPVIDNDKVIGIITATDLVNQFAICTEEDLRNMYCQTICKIYQQSPYK